MVTIVRLSVLNVRMDNPSLVRENTLPYQARKSPTKLKKYLKLPDKLLQKRALLLYFRFAWQRFCFQGFEQLCDCETHHGFIL